MPSKEKQPRIIILSGPSGAGKTTLHDRLLASPRFAGRIIRSISATTRLPRGTEKPGVDYIFLTEKQFQQKISKGAFLEWARVFDRYYGTPVKNVQETLKKGLSVLLCIDVQGGRQVKERVPAAVSVFIKSPTLTELRRRLEMRRTDSNESIALRLKTARLELKQARHYDHVVVNDDLARAGRELEELVASYIG
ncbi:MAG: guanylate kinase [Candidatus Omnitrophota bacterium]